MKRKIFLLIAPILCFFGVIGLTSCHKSKPVDPVVEHTCEHICPRCGKCTDATCTDPVCSIKCPGHSEVHVCNHVCPTCGNCMDASCTDTVCANKCPGHSLIHTCESVCSVCGKCLNKDCTDAACADKCPGHQPIVTEHGNTCESVCSVCGKCLNKNCTNSLCADKCPGHAPTGIKTIVDIEVDDGKYYEGMPLSECVKYREVYDDSSKGEWVTFFDDELSSVVVSGSKATCTATLYRKIKTFTVNISCDVSDATIDSLIVASEPETKVYTKRNTAYSSLNLLGGTLDVKFSDGKIFNVPMTNSMLPSSGKLDIGDNEVLLSLGGKVAHITLTTKIMSVKDIKTLSGTYDLDCIVVGATTIRNATYSPMLIVKDIETDDMIGITHTGLCGEPEAIQLSTIAKGDRIVATVSTISFTDVSSNGASALQKFLTAESKDSSKFKSSLEIISHNNNFTPNMNSEDVVEIASEQQLRDFVLSKKGHYKFVKLSGVKAIYAKSGANDYTFYRIFFGNTVTSYSQQCIPMFDGQNTSPGFSSTTLASMLGSNYKSIIFTHEGDDTYTNPSTSSKDIYCVYVGGNSYYEVFTPFDASWIVDHDCTTGGHVISNPSSYEVQGDKVYSIGTCTSCGLTNVKSNGTKATSVSDAIVDKAVGTKSYNVVATVMGFGGEYQKEVSSKLQYILLGDNNFVAAFNAVNTDNLPTNMRVSGFGIYVDDHKLEVGDKIYFPMIAVKQAPYYLGNAKGTTCQYVGHSDDFEGFDPSVVKSYPISGSMISGGSEGGINKFVATEDNPLYINGYIDPTTGKNIITFYEKSNTKINDDTLTENDKKNMTYTVNSYSRILGCNLEVMVASLGEDFFKTNFEEFKDGIEGHTLDCTKVPLGTYAFTGTVYYFYNSYGNTYVSETLLKPGCTLVKLNTTEPVIA